MLEIGRLDDGRPERFGRLLAYNIVDVGQQAPSTPSGEQSRNGVCQTMLERGYDDTARASRHTLHVAEHEGRGDRVRFAGTSPGYNNGSIGTDELRQPLRGVKINFLHSHRSLPSSAEAAPPVRREDAPGFHISSSKSASS